MSQYETGLLALGWSLWTELGVAGTTRQHTHWAIDPEPLLVASPFLFGADARLMDQVYGWCSEQSQWLSASRVRALWKASDPYVQHAFAPLAATLRLHADVRWLKDGPAADRAPSFSPTRLQLERPALLAFRLRALCGVGARADVLLALLTHAAWLRSSQLAHLGYAKRRIAEVLDALHQGGVVDKRSAGNALEFKLPRHSPLAALCRAEGLDLRSWAPFLRTLMIAKRIDGLRDKPEGVRRVSTHKALQEMQQAAAELDRPAPMLVAEAEDPVQAALDWLQESAD